MTLRTGGVAQPVIAGSGGRGIDERSLARTVLLTLKDWDPGQVTIEDLATGLGVSRRDIEAALEDLRQAGEPIIADDHGVGYTEDLPKLTAYMESRRRRSVAIYLGTRGIRRAIRRIKEREDLTLWVS